MTENHSLFCGSRHHKMERFMEVCLLLLLSEEKGHGYGLIEKLTYFGFTEEQLNVGTLYKTLRKMEKEGAVESAWEKGGQGPKKRVYNITDNGEKELGKMVQILKDRKARIEKLISRYELFKVKDANNMP